MPPKKSKTPPPPRRVQAPRTRTDGAGDERKSRLLLYGLAASGIVALIAVIALLALGGGSSASASAAKTIRDQGCKFRTYKELPRSPHYDTLTPAKPPKWNSVPPTSGRHYTQAVVFGPYEEPISEIQAVHNLEHGAVIVQWGDKVPKAEVDRITSWYRDDPNALIVAPYPKLGDKIALTAWTRWAECGKFDQKAFDAFRKAFRYKAPEKFPKDFLNPGQ